MAQLNSLIVTGDSRFLNTINGNITSANGIHRATMETSSTATAFVLTADGIDSLYDGLIIVCKNIKVASASGCTINLNGLGAKSIWLSQANSACTTHWGLNQTYFFTYDEANSRWELQQGRDTNSTYNFSGTTFYSGNSSNATHNANDAVKNGNYYYNSNGPSTTLGASNDGGLYVQSYSDTWVGQIAQDYRDGDIFVRGKNNGTWSDWKKPDAGTVNGHTVAKDVPSNAVFTDTTYTGTGVISVNASTHVISTTAEVNQNAFSNVKVGSTTVAADTKTDTIEFVAGSNVTLTPDATNDKITIAASTGNKRAFFGTCSTAAATAAKVVTLSDTDGWELKAGTVVGVKFSIKNTASNVTLNVNNSGNKSIFFDSSVYTGSAEQITGGKDKITYYMYDGNNWCFINRSDNYRDTNNDTYDKNRYTGTIKCNATTAIVAGNIIVGENGTYHHLKDGTQFDISYPILYANGALAVNATGNNNYDIIAFTITTTQSITLTPYLPVYIKGLLNGEMFKPISTTPLTQTVPMSEDGYHYMLLGTAYSATTVYLTEDHRIFAYINGFFSEVIDNTLHLNGMSSTWSAAVSALTGDTTVTIPCTALNSSSVVDVYTQNSSGTPTILNSVIVTAGVSAAITFDALTENTDFKIHVMNM